MFFFEGGGSLGTCKCSIENANNKVFISRVGNVFRFTFKFCQRYNTAKLFDAQSNISKT